MKFWVKYLFVFLLFSLIFRPQIVKAWPGCCSHHGGVCGCGCCDGSGLSSTCAPHYPECSGGGRVVIPTSKPKIIPTRIPTQRPAPTYKPIPTLKPTKTIRPTSTPKPTRIPSIKPSPTEIILPTEIQLIDQIPTSIPKAKTVESQNFLSKLFSWLFR